MLAAAWQAQRAPAAAALAGRPRESSSCSRTRTGRRHQQRCGAAANPSAALQHARQHASAFAAAAAGAAAEPCSNNAVPLPHSNSINGAAAAAAAAAAAVAATAAVATTFEAPAEMRVRHQHMQQQQQQQQAQPLQQQQQHEAVLFNGAGRGRRVGRTTSSSSSSLDKYAGAQARQLTRAIMDADSWQQLQQLHQQRRPDMNLIHVSAVMTRLTRCLQQQQHPHGQAPPAAQQASQQLAAFLQQLDQHVCQLLSAVQLPQASAVEVLRSGTSSTRLLLLLQGGAQPVMPQQLANLARCHAALGHQPSVAWWSCLWAASDPLLPGFSAGELACTLWGAGKLQQAPPPAWMARFEAACTSGGALASATPQELCMMLQGLAVLRLVPGAAWVACLQDAVLVQLPRMRPRDISQVVWAHASLGLQQPPAWTHAVLDASACQAARFSARDTAMLLWALAAASRHQPDNGSSSSSVGGGGGVGGSMSSPQQQQQQQQQQADEQLGVLVSRLLGSLQLSSCKLDAAQPQDLAHIAWALAVLQRREEQQQHAGLRDTQLWQWFKLTWQLTLPPASAPSSSSGATHHQPRRGAGGVTATDAAQLLWAASQLGPECAPPAEWLQRYWAASADCSHLAGASPQALAMCMWAATRLGQPPPARWLVAATPRLQQQLAELQPAAACQLLAVLARTGHRPSPGFMQQLLCRLQLDAHQLQPRAFACVLWALAVLGYQPGATWWQTLGHHLGLLVPSLGPRELANVLQGLRALLLDDEEEAGGALPAPLRDALLARAAQLGLQQGGDQQQPVVAAKKKR